jgi:hypothetical protein
MSESITLTMINDRMDRMENKIDHLIEFKYTWVGRFAVLSVIGTMTLSIFINYLSKKMS